jgi:hypothetical protein
MSEKKHTPEMAAKIEAGRARRDAFIAATGIDFKAVADAGFDANSGKPNLSDNAELVHFQYAGLYFSALVDLMPDEQEVAVFYENGDVTELLKLFMPGHRIAIKRLAVVAAMKQRAEQAAHDEEGDQIE